MSKVSVVMPVYNVESFIAQAISSVLRQTHTDFELLIVDDCSTDNSAHIYEQFLDPRLRIIRHSTNRGLAGARNTGIRHARGELIAFIDSDDVWHLDKLTQHLAHLQRSPHVGISFSRSMFVHPDGSLADYYQMPRLRNIDAAYCLCRNPVGNGSAAVVRRTALEAIRYEDDRHGASEARFFDEDLRQSEDIECWLRILLKSDWQMEGIAPALTYYRLNAGGLSAHLDKQYASWEQALKKASAIAPALVSEWEVAARAFQLRYLARQAIRLRDGHSAVRLANRALRVNPAILKSEPGKTLSTLAAAYLLLLLPRSAYGGIEAFASRLIGGHQLSRIKREMHRDVTLVEAG